jgi:hypothetical protein
MCDVTGRLHRIQLALAPGWASGGAELPRLGCVGDSIRMGYEPTVAHREKEIGVQGV